jgi:hypothetical protein
MYMKVYNKQNMYKKIKNLSFAFRPLSPNLNLLFFLIEPAAKSECIQLLKSK